MRTRWWLLAGAVLFGTASTFVGGGLVVTPSNYTLTLTTTGNTTLTLPTSGKLMTQATPPYGMAQLMGYKTGVDFNVTTDTAIPLVINGSKWRAGWTPNAASGGGVIVTNCSATPTLAAGTVYTGAGKTGMLFGTNTDTYTGASSSVRTVQNSGTSTSITNTRTETTVYFSLTTANGSALTCDVYIVGTVFP